MTKEGENPSKIEIKVILIKVRPMSMENFAIKILIDVKSIFKLCFY